MRIAGFATATLAVLLAGGADAQPPADDRSPIPPTSEAVTQTPPAAVATNVPSDVTAPASSAVTYQIGNSTVTNTVVTNGPIADTPENRAKYGLPLSRAGNRTVAKGN